MGSWMSANFSFFTISILTLCIGCIPPAYRPSHTVPKNTTKEKSYQQFNYNDSDSIPILQDDDNYYIRNESYTTQPVYYSMPQADTDSYYQNDDTKETKSNKKSSDKGRWHTIKKGETLYRLSKQYNTTVDAICDANNIKDFTSIKVGQKIFIPTHSVDKNIPSKNSYTSKRSTKESAVSLPFIWPVSSVIAYTHDQGGVRPIGIVITSRPKSKVVASAQGKVVKIGAMRGFGNFIVIMHQKDFYTIYSKLDAITVKEGQVVPKGTTIGILSDSNPSLHFQINHSGKPLDPLHYLAQK